MVKSALPFWEHLSFAFTVEFLPFVNEYQKYSWKWISPWKYEVFWWSGKFDLKDIGGNPLGKSSKKKKHGYFTVRLTVRVDPPRPPYGQLICVFSEGCIWLLFMNIHKLKQILTKKKCFDPLFDPLAEWRWALQEVTNATMEPRMQWWEVH